MLKFEGKFKVGDIIKSYDFKPSPYHPENYIIGKVLEEKHIQYGFNSYKVELIERFFKGESDKRQAGDIILVPHQIDILEYDDRITKVD